MKKVIIILLLMSLTKLLISCCNPPGSYYFYTVSEGIEANIYERIYEEQKETDGAIIREQLVLKVDVHTKTASDSTELSLSGFTFNSAKACNDYGAYEQHLDIIKSLKIYAGIPDSIGFEEVTNSFFVLNYGNLIETEKYFASRHSDLKDSPYMERRNYFDLVFARNYQGFPDGTVFKVEVFLSSGDTFVSESAPIAFED